MQTFFAKCAAVGIVAGGFALTGDAWRLMERGQRLLDAHTVPSEAPAESPAAVDVAPVAASESVRATVPTPSAPASTVQSAAATPAVLTPQNTLLNPPLGRTVAVPAPPAQSPDSIDVRALSPGSRVLVWVRRQGAVGRGRAVDLLALDIIDPNTGEALEHRHADMTHGSEPTTVHAAPRRVVITLGTRGQLAKNSMLRVAPRHGVNGLGTEETVGQLVAIDVQSR